MPTQSPLPPATCHPHHCDSYDYFLFHKVEKGILYCLDCETPPDLAGVDSGRRSTLESWPTVWGTA